MRTTDSRLELLRGSLPTRNHNARTVAALAANPGCARRGVMDAAGIDKTALAARLGHPMQYGQSPFAIVRGHAFEAQVKADEGAELRRLLAEVLGGAAQDVVEGEYTELGGDPADEAAPADETDPADPAGPIDEQAPHNEPAPDQAPASTPAKRPGREERVALTRSALRRALDTARPELCAILDHPLLPLDVAGTRAYLEPDAMACVIAGRLHIVEIKSFSVIDGNADPSKLASASRQAAVYVLALQRMAVELGHRADMVSTDIVLVCAKDFSNQPIAALLDIRRELAVTRRRLARLARVEELLEPLPTGLTFDLETDPDADPAVAAAALGGAVGSVPAAYVPGCLSACELAYFCRAEARTCDTGHGSGGLVGTLGTGIRGQLGGIDDIGRALDLADGKCAPARGEEEIAHLLRRAEALRREVLGAPRTGAPAGAGPRTGAAS
ncbi:hypothetical protein [Yinghuangia seranimata]|uniref:hypothetical protein n=1 Tax=Yinghuangia seranimata TaxID=408067 RepID=UPI00248BA6B8|nr:hypothetical protein [Yinghuangia seranimata]MDI2132564.1 hypothetical protein [Yinghuangia seranimata]